MCSNYCKQFANIVQPEQIAYREQLPGVDLDLEGGEVLKIKET